MSNLPLNLPHALYGFIKRITDPDHFARNTDQEEAYRLLVDILVDKGHLSAEDRETLQHKLTALGITPLSRRIDLRFEEIFRHIGPLSVVASPIAAAAPGVGFDCLRITDFPNLQAAVDALPAAGG